MSKDAKTEETGTLHSDARPPDPFEDSPELLAGLNALEYAERRSSGLMRPHIKRKYLDATKEMLGLNLNNESAILLLVERCGLEMEEAFEIVSEAWEELLATVNEPESMKLARAIAFYSHIIQGQQFTVASQMKARERLDELTGLMGDKRSGGMNVFGNVQIANIGKNYRAPDREEVKQIDGFFEKVLGEAARDGEEKSEG